MDDEFSPTPCSAGAARGRNEPAWMQYLPYGMQLLGQITTALLSRPQQPQPLGRVDVDGCGCGRHPSPHFAADAPVVLFRALLPSAGEPLPFLAFQMRVY